MDKDNAYYELIILVNKYINCDKEKKKILAHLKKNKNTPPVRSVIKNVFKHSNFISVKDKVIIADLMYYFEGSVRPGTIIE